MSDNDREETTALDRMVYTGCMWLNSAFRIKAPKRTAGGRFFSFRADFGEIAWGLLCAFIVVGLQITAWIAAGNAAPGPLFLLWHPIAWVAYGIAAFMFGRRMAHISPYRSYSGESATQWANVVIRKSIGRAMSRLGYSRMCYNRVLTTMRDKSGHGLRETWAREWLGIAPAPYAPHVSNPWKTSIHNEIAVARNPNIEVYPDAGNTLEEMAKAYRRSNRAAVIRQRLKDSDKADNLDDLLS